MKKHSSNAERGQNTKQKLSRRKTLFGIGALGVASSGLPIASANGNGNGAQSLDNEIVLDWVDAALETARRGLIIPTSGRVYAFLGAVMYDAVNGIHKQRGEGFEAGNQYAVEPDVVPGACRVAALAGGAHEILSTLAEEELGEETVDALIEGDDEFEGYDAILDRHVEEYNDGDQDVGKVWGRQVARAIRDKREGAGSDCQSDWDVVDDKDDLAPGMAQLGDAWGSACLADLEPWGFDVEDADDYPIRAPEPPELESLEFAVEYNRTLVVGDLGRDVDEIQGTEVAFDISEDRYDEEKAEDLADGTYVGGAVENEELGYSEDIEYDEDEDELTLTIDPPDDFREQGAFWAALGGTPQPEGRWLQVAKAAVEKDDDGPGFYETVRLYARLGIAVQDAGIVNWNNKRHYAEDMGWRPHAATGSEDDEQVPERALDWPNVDDLDNPDLETKDDWYAISGWSPAPEYASGLTTVSTTSQRLLEDEFGEDFGPLEVTVDTAEGNRDTGGDELTEEYDDFADARNQAAKSRVWSGRHYAPAMLAAIEMADKIVDEVKDAI